MILKKTCKAFRLPYNSDMLTPKISEEEICARAYERFVERGYRHGNDVEDWLAAEAELRAEAIAPSRKVAPKNTAPSARPSKTVRR